MAYPVFRALKRLGYEDVTVAHPKDLVWIVKSKKKNDNVDSLKIAKLHMHLDEQTNSILCSLCCLCSYNLIILSALLQAYFSNRKF